MRQHGSGRRLSIGLTMLGAGVLAAGTMAATPAQQPTFRQSTHTVSVYATVRGHDGRLVTGLTQQDFQVRDDGRPAPLTVFSNAPQPMAVAVLVDLGLSIQLARGMRAARAFIAGLRPDDTAVVGTFGEEMFLMPALTSRHDQLFRVLDHELWPLFGNGSGWQHAAIDRAAAILDRASSRRVILLFYDGSNGNGCLMAISSQCRSYDDAEQHAIASGVLVYAVEFPQGRAEIQVPRRSGGLNDLTEATGGGHLRLTATDDPVSAMDELARELRSQYLLGFEPRSLDGRMHRLEIRGPAGLTVRARRSYLAAP